MFQSFFFLKKNDLTNKNVIKVFTMNQRTLYGLESLELNSATFHQQTYPLTPPPKKSLLLVFLSIKDKSYMRSRFKFCSVFPSVWLNMGIQKAGYKHGHISRWDRIYKRNMRSRCVFTCFINLTFFVCGHYWLSC